MFCLPALCSGETVALWLCLIRSPQVVGGISLLQPCCSPRRREQLELLCVSFFPVEKLQLQWLLLVPSVTALSPLASDPQCVPRVIPWVFRPGLSTGSRRWIAGIKQTREQSEYLWQGHYRGSLSPFLSHRHTIRRSMEGYEHGTVLWRGITDPQLLSCPPAQGCAHKPAWTLTPTVRTRRDPREVSSAAQTDTTQVGAGLFTPLCSWPGISNRVTLPQRCKHHLLPSWDGWKRGGVFPETRWGAYTSTGWNAYSQGWALMRHFRASDTSPEHNWEQIQLTKFKSKSVLVSPHFLKWR